MLGDRTPVTDCIGSRLLCTLTCSVSPNSIAGKFINKVENCPISSVRAGRKRVHLHVPGVCSHGQGWCWDGAVLAGVQDPAPRLRRPL